jgi:hypothetical protein
VRDTCISLFNKEQEEKAYKIYVADCLRLITENTAASVGGSYITMRWADVINPQPQKEQKEGEAKERIISKLRS